MNFPPTDKLITQRIVPAVWMGDSVEGVTRVMWFEIFNTDIIKKLP